MRFIAVLPPLFMFAGLGLTSAGVLPAMYGWGLMAFAVLFGPAISLTILFSRARKGQPHFRVFEIIAIRPLAVAAPIAVHDLSYPLINDVTTDIENPLGFDAALEAPANAGRDMTYPERSGRCSGAIRERIGHTQALANVHMPNYIIHYRSYSFTLDSRI